jgi:hypothetical protein
LRSAGILVRVLDAATVTPERTPLLPDLAIFDEAVSYELTVGPRLGAANTPYYVKTLLQVRTAAVQGHIQRFNDYWEIARPLDR